MKTSSSVPSGDINTWPVYDYNAFVAVLRCSYRHLREAIVELDLKAPDLEARFHISITECVGSAARELGLQDGQSHWMVDNILAGHFGIFYDTGGDIFWDAEGFLEHASHIGREHLGADMVEWAQMIAAYRSGH